MSKPLLLLQLKIIILLILRTTEDDIFYVLPSVPSGLACPANNPCHTLDEYAMLQFGFSNHVVLLLLDGIHEMSPEQSLELSEVENFKLSTLNDSMGAKVLIKMFKVTFTTIQTLEIEKVELQGGSVSAFDVCQMILNQVSFTNYEFALDGSKYFRMSDAILVDDQFTLSTHSLNLGDGCYFPSAENTPTIEIIGVQIYGNSTFMQVNLESGTATIYDSLISGHSVINVYSVPKFLRAKSTTTPNFLEIVNCSFMFLQNMYLADLGINERHFVALIINSTFFESKIEAIIHKFTFQNSFLVGSHASSYGMFLKGPMNVTINNSTFNKNRALVSTLRAENINLFFLGSTTFLNNIGSTGAAIEMSRSTIWLDKNTQVSFVNNSATQIGGAISISEQIINSGQLRKQCFYQLKFDTQSIRQSNVSINFSYNQAKVAGDNIYGAALQDDCIVDISHTNRQKNYQVQNTIFQFHTKSFSSVSSNPRRICLCSRADKPRCIDIDYIYYSISIRPGEKFNLSLVVVGNDFGTITGGVYASKVEESEPFKFSAGEDSQQVITNKKCTNLEYSLQLTNKYVKKVLFLLSTDSIAASLQKASLNNMYSKSDIATAASSIATQHKLFDAPIVVTAHILSCPLGFDLLAVDYQDYICDCEEVVRGYVHDCTVENGVGFLHRNQSVWIGTREWNNKTVLSAHRFCPFSYCLSEVVKVRLNDSDNQCAFNHSGALCGGCSPGLSLAIGSSRCIDCPDNYYISLLLVFILVGVILIFFINFFDLTVAHGTLNGLIFYANSIWIHEGIFFSDASDQIDSRIVLFMKGFVAWLNLDFGIEMCFINGLDAYSKTWLQFIFPFYVWILAGIIVLACHYSTRATKLFRNNALPVLTTMFFLSYAKLLRTIVLIFGPAIIQEYDQVHKGRIWVWLLDGNVPYLGDKHVFLFIMASFVLIFLWVPYTLALLFARQLYKLPYNSCFRKLMRIKPLLDTYTGPLKVKYQFWVGLMLLIRVLFAISAVAFQTINPVINIDILLLTCVLACMIVLHAYKKWYVTLLELSYLFNLIILSIIFLSTEATVTRLISICISVGICLLTFLGILGFHVAHICFSRKKKLCPKYKQRDNNIEGDTLNAAEAQSVRVVSTTTVDLHKLLLEKSED